MQTFEQVKAFVGTSPRYGLLEYNSGRVEAICHECSTRTTGVVMAFSDVEYHETFHAEDARQQAEREGARLVR